MGLFLEQMFCEVIIKCVLFWNEFYHKNYWNNKLNRQTIFEYIEKNSVNWYNNDKQGTAVKS